MIEGKDYWVTNKDNSKLMRFIAKLLFFNKRFMTSYVTTIGRVIYAPGGVVDDITLKHELKHVEDYAKNRPWFVFSYLCVGPAFFTMRAHWERRAFEVTIREMYKVMPDYVRSPAFKDWIMRIFTGPDYFYMSTKGATSKWFDKLLAELMSEKRETFLNL